ncbi:hypothetical protein LP422_00425 [Janibacter limosus]|uniref:Uncharacterized protein n=1 Tax=Janibacter limosus TaxID=53458 RepID=A0AC61U4J3_9MICO|nr:hypothetical protein [Janibacter limosus]UUZ44908.1 hypothetical protein LP422_00425 [Janibacter limosus]
MVGTPDRHGSGSRDAGEAHDGSLDLARLDPVTTDLQLTIGPPHEVQEVVFFDHEVARGIGPHTRPLTVDGQEGSGAIGA